MSEPATIYRGSVYVLGNNIDTDQIIPAEHLIYSLTDPEESQLYGRYCFSSVPPAQSGLPQGNVSFNTQQPPFKIVIAGSNFGCGSSREHAPFAMQKAGILAVVATSYARIFYRNSIDGGFVAPLESRQSLVPEFQTGDEAEINLSTSEITNLRTGKTYPLNPLGDVAPILKAGNLFAYAKTLN